MNAAQSGDERRRQDSIRQVRSSISHRASLSVAMAELSTNGNVTDKRFDKATEYAEKRAVQEMDRKDIINRDIDSAVAEKRRKRKERKRRRKESLSRSQSSGDGSSSMDEYKSDGCGTTN